VARKIELDWVLIRIVTVRRIVATAILALIAAALVWVTYKRLNPPPDVAARRAIEKAEAVHEETLSQTIPEALHAEFRQAESQLESARSAYGEEKFGDALNLANEARARFESLAGGDSGGMEVGVGQFFGLEGRVSVQRAGKSEWTVAHRRMPLFNGDFVKTGRDGTAEILFADGSLFKIAPNSLLEIHHERADSTEATVKMVSGVFDINTSDSDSMVSTETTRTTVLPDSRVRIGVEEDRRTQVAVREGGATVRNPRGDEVELRNREVVATSDTGDFSEKTRLPRPPIPVAPQNNAPFTMGVDPVIELRWEQTAKSAAVHLQVSRSKRFFADRLDVDESGLAKDHARLKAVAPGTYYWRLASVVDASLESEWSQVRRFQVLAPANAEILDDRTPPILEVSEVQQLGAVFIVQGRTEVGATVTVNGEAVEPESDGTFRKAVEATRTGINEVVVIAVDPAGNSTPYRTQVNVDIY